MSNQLKIKPIAFYLPQYHPIPENNAWWGKGFTEWTNVTKAKPLFPGHYQPHLPADLGFYDLRLPEIRQEQADLAQKYGIYGFCYYHYWFNGKRLLQRPFQEVLESGQPNFPFCLCWANEPWTRSWDSLSGEILIDQKYSEEEDILHIKYLAEVFKDPRYIRVENRPLFLIYRISKIPDIVKKISFWREEFRKIGIGEIFLAQVENTFGDFCDPRKNGLEASVEFQPYTRDLGLPLPLNFYHKIRQKLGLKYNHYRYNKVFYDYNILIKKYLERPLSNYPKFPCLMTSWDNTARRKIRPTIFLNSNPELYEHWLREIVKKRLSPYFEEKFVFINAWNEWAEGAHLEPCQKWGTAYLEATYRVIIEFGDVS